MSKHKTIILPTELISAYLLLLLRSNQKEKDGFTKERMLEFCNQHFKNANAPDKKTLSASPFLEQHLNNLFSSVENFLRVLDEESRERSSTPGYHQDVDLAIFNDSFFDSGLEKRFELLDNEEVDMIIKITLFCIYTQSSDKNHTKSQIEIFKKSLKGKGETIKSLANLLITKQDPASFITDKRKQDILFYTIALSRQAEVIDPHFADKFISDLMLEALGDKDKIEKIIKIFSGWEKYIKDLQKGVEGFDDVSSYLGSLKTKAQELESVATEKKCSDVQTLLSVFNFKNDGSLSIAKQAQSKIVGFLNNIIDKGGFGADLVCFVGSNQEEKKAFTEIVKCLDDSRKEKIITEIKALPAKSKKVFCSNFGVKDLKEFPNILESFVKSLHQKPKIAHNQSPQDVPDVPSNNTNLSSLLKIQDPQEKKYFEAVLKKNNIGEQFDHFQAAILLIVALSDDLNDSNSNRESCYEIEEALMFYWVKYGGEGQDQLIGSEANNFLQNCFVTLSNEIINFIKNIPEGNLIENSYFDPLNILFITKNLIGTKACDLSDGYVENLLTEIKSKNYDAVFKKPEDVARIILSFSYPAPSEKIKSNILKLIDGIFEVAGNDPQKLGKIEKFLGALGEDQIILGKHDKKGGERKSNYVKFCADEKAILKLRGDLKGIIQQPRQDLSYINKQSVTVTDILDVLARKSKRPSVNAKLIQDIIAISKDQISRESLLSYIGDEKYSDQLLSIIDSLGIKNITELLQEVPLEQKIEIFKIRQLKIEKYPNIDQILKPLAEEAEEQKKKTRQQEIAAIKQAGQQEQGSKTPEQIKEEEKDWQELKRDVQRQETEYLKLQSEYLQFRNQNEVRSRDILESEKFLKNLTDTQNSLKEKNQKLKKQPTQNPSFVKSADQEHPTLTQPKSNLDLEKTEYEKLQEKLRKLEEVKQYQEKRIAELNKSITRTNQENSALARENSKLEQKLEQEELYKKRRQEIEKQKQELLERNKDSGNKTSQAEIIRELTEYPDKEEKLRSNLENYQTRTNELKQQKLLQREVEEQKKQNEGQVSAFDKLSQQVNEGIARLQESIDREYKALYEQFLFSCSSLAAYGFQVPPILELSYNPKQKCQDNIIDSFPQDILSILQGVQQLEKISLVGSRVYSPLLHIFGHTQFQVKPDSDFDIHCAVDENFNSETLQIILKAAGYTIENPEGKVSPDGVYNFKIKSNKSGEVVDLSFYKPKALDKDGWRFNFERLRLSSTKNQDGTFSDWHADINNNLTSQPAQSFDGIMENIWLYNNKANGFFSMFFEGKGASDHLVMSKIKELLPKLADEMTFLCKKNKVIYSENFDEFVSLNAFKQDPIRLFYLGKVYEEYKERLRSDQKAVEDLSAPENLESEAKRREFEYGKVKILQKKPSTTTQKRPDPEFKEYLDKYAIYKREKDASFTFTKAEEERINSILEKNDNVTVFLIPSGGNQDLSGQFQQYLSDKSSATRANFKCNIFSAFNDTGAKGDSNSHWTIKYHQHPVDQSKSYSIGSTADGVCGVHCVINALCHSNLHQEGKIKDLLVELGIDASDIRKNGSTDHQKAILFAQSLLTNAGLDDNKKAYNKLNNLLFDPNNQEFWMEREDIKLLFDCIAKLAKNIAIVVEENSFETIKQQKKDIEHRAQNAQDNITGANGAPNKLAEEKEFREFLTTTEKLTAEQAQKLIDKASISNSLSSQKQMVRY